MLQKIQEKIVKLNQLKKSLKKVKINQAIVKDELSELKDNPNIDKFLSSHGSQFINAINETVSSANNVIKRDNITDPNAQFGVGLGMGLMKGFSLGDNALDNDINDLANKIEIYQKQIDALNTDIEKTEQELLQLQQRKQTHQGVHQAIVNSDLVKANPMPKLSTMIHSFFAADCPSCQLEDSPDQVVSSSLYNVSSFK